MLWEWCFLSGCIGQKVVGYISSRRIERLVFFTSFLRERMCVKELNVAPFSSCGWLKSILQVLGHVIFPWKFERLGHILALRLLNLSFMRT